MEHPNPDATVAGLAAGDERAYAALYDQYGVGLYRAAVGMLGRREDAEDAVQDVFWSVLRSRHNLVTVHDLTAYLFATLRSAAARCVARRERVAREIADSMDGMSLSTGAGTPSTSYSDELEHALAALPMQQREVLALKIDGGLTFAQISHVLGVSINTASSRYRYALEKLRDSLKPLATSFGNADNGAGGGVGPMPLQRLEEENREARGSAVDEKLGIAVRPATA